MATAMLFEDTLKDAAKTDNAVALEFGRSANLKGENLVYLVIDDKAAALGEASGKKRWAADRSAPMIAKMHDRYVVRLRRRGERSVDFGRWWFRVMVSLQIALACILGMLLVLLNFAHDY